MLDRLYSIKSLLHEVYDCLKEISNLHDINLSFMEEVVEAPAENLEQDIRFNI